jgi:DNA-binding LytR/AlgR family response regulator
MKISRVVTKKKVTLRIDADVDEAAFLRLEHYLQREQTSILVKKSGRSFSIIYEDVYYLEATESTTKVWTEHDAFQSDLPLYAWVDAFPTFVRIHKSYVVNLLHIHAFESTFNGRLLIILKNRDRLVVSRKYVSIIKQRLGGR